MKFKKQVLRVLVWACNPPPHPESLLDSHSQKHTYKKEEYFTNVYLISEEWRWKSNILICEAIMASTYEEITY